MTENRKEAETLIKSYAEAPCSFKKGHSNSLAGEYSTDPFSAGTEMEKSNGRIVGNELDDQDNTLSLLLGELGVADSEGIGKRFLTFIPHLRDALLKDLEAMFQGDPAAKSREEIILTYPGFAAIVIYRVANFFFREGVPLLPRISSEYAHQMTGIDIHPSATIGHSFCIDHGTGLVIGETAHIGDRVKIYQGVTLGALSVKKDLSHTKRHPTIEDDVVIYANTTILGGETVVGKGSMIGGNVWLTESVPAASKVYGKFESEIS